MHTNINIYNIRAYAYACMCKISVNTVKLIYICFFFFRDSRRDEGQKGEKNRGWMSPANHRCAAEGYVRKSFAFTHHNLRLAHVPARPPGLDDNRHEASWLRTVCKH